MVTSAVFFSRAAGSSSTATKKDNLTFSSNLLSIDVLKEANRLSSAQISLIDNDPRSDYATFFAPGNEIDIQIGTEIGNETSLFLGVVVKYATRHQNNLSFLDISLKDIAIKLTAQRKNAIFLEMEDKAIIEKIAKAQGLKADLSAVTQPSLQHPELVQYYCSDWDFILARAEASGLWVTVSDGTLTVIPAALSSTEKSWVVTNTAESPTVYIQDSTSTQTWAIDALEIEADIQQQYGEVYGQAWSEKDQTVTAPAQATAIPLPKSLSDSWASALDTQRCDLVSGLELPAEEVTAWANAQLVKTRQSLLRGWVSVGGCAEVLPGSLLTLANISELFDGLTRASGIRHQISREGWQTEIQIGTTAEWFAQKTDIALPPASGLLPAVSGLQIGIVDTFEADSTQQGRVRVRIPALSTQGTEIAQKGQATSDDATKGCLVWAKRAELWAGPNRGSFFRPEPGDEVILGFLHNDPRQAVILGALHSQTHTPPLEIEETYAMKGLVTRKNLKVTFNDTDDEEAIALETPQGCKVILSDKKGDESIQLVDKHNNSIIMNKDGIAISSQKKICLTGEAVEVA